MREHVKPGRACVRDDDRHNRTWNGEPIPALKGSKSGLREFMLDSKGLMLAREGPTIANSIYTVA